MTRKKSLDPRDYQLPDGYHRGYTYFISQDGPRAFHWELLNRDGDTLCSGNSVATKADCLKSLRAVQRHAATTDMRDDT
jgi:uncharacterized protein YegP (UPF0339 family)